MRSKMGALIVMGGLITNTAKVATQRPAKKPIPGKDAIPDPTQKPGVKAIDDETLDPKGPSKPNKKKMGKMKPPSVKESQFKDDPIAPGPQAPAAGMGPSAWNPSRNRAYINNKARVGTALRHFTINLDAPKVRYENFEGKQHMIVPMVMITKGVHNGSGGPLYYPEEELAKTPEVWNAKPVVVYHPEINGQGVSACDPDIMQARKIGTIFNTVWDGTKLKAEAYLDPDRVKAIDNRIMEKLEKKEMVELSTGLFTDNIAKEGEWNGKDYVAVATNYRPDHLAILPDQKGACSIEDGAGLLRTNALSHDDIRDQLHTQLRGKATKGAYPYVHAVYDKSFVYHDDQPNGGKLMHQGYKKTDSGVDLVGDPQEVNRVTEYRDLKGKVVGNKFDEDTDMDDLDTDDPEVEDAEALSEHDFEQKAVKIKATKDNEATRTPAQVLGFNKMSRFKKLVGKLKGKVDDPAAVAATIGRKKYGDKKFAEMSKKGKKAATNAQASGQDTIRTNQEDANVNKAQLIAALIANGSWTEEDKPILEKMQIEKLQLLKELDEDSDEPEEEGNKTSPKAGKKKKSATTNEEQDPPRPVTVEDYINNAPSQIRDLLNSGIKLQDRTKTALIKTIMANKQNSFEEKWLGTKDLDFLQAIARLAAPTENNQPSMLQPNFSGMGDGFTANASLDASGGPITNEEPLSLPDFAFGPKK